MAAVLGGIPRMVKVLFKPMAHTRLVVRPLIDTKTGIFCHLVEFGGVKIVVDCGIDESFDYSLYDNCIQEIRSADCILITSFALSHMGAVGMFADKSVYCAVPTAVLGQIVLRDCGDKYKSLFDKTIKMELNTARIKFSQPFKIGDVEICAFNAGCCAGNSLYRISYGMESILVGYDLNQRKVNYTDGLDLELLRGSSTLITNSVYARVPPYTVKERNQLLHDEIKGCSGKVIIAVQFVGLIEVLSIIPSEKVIVVSRHGKLFVDRLKSMVEWAGTRANDIFVDLDVDFGKADDIADHNVVIVVTAVPEASYLGTLLERLSEPTNLLLLINMDKERIKFEKLPICTFQYTTRSIKAPDISSVSAVNNDNDEEDENMHWTKHSNVIFVKQLDRRSLFPHVQRKVHRNDYGETFQIVAEKKSEQPIKETHDDEVEEVESATVLSVGVAPRCTIKEFTMYCVCDFESSRAVVDGLGVQNLILVNDCGTDSEFYHASFYSESSALFVQLCAEEARITFNNVVNRSTFDEEILNLKYKTIGNRRISKFIANRKEEVINVEGNYPPMIVGTLTLLKLRKALLNKGFCVELDGNTLIVNGMCVVAFVNTTLLLNSDDDALLVGVRNVIYEFIAII